MHNLTDRQIKLLRYYMPGDRTLEGSFNSRTFSSLIKRRLLAAVEVARGDYGTPFTMIKLTDDGVDAVLAADAKAIELGVY